MVTDLCVIQFPLVVHITCQRSKVVHRIFFEKMVYGLKKVENCCSNASQFKVQLSRISSLHPRIRILVNLDIVVTASWFVDKKYTQNVIYLSVNALRRQARSQG